MNNNLYNNPYIAITGSTGGLGKEICKQLASAGYNIILVDRNQQKSKEHADELINNYGINAINVVCDLENMQSVKNAVEQLRQIEFDTLILNAGIYNVPIKKLDTGYNNIFQVNFLSQYYLARKLLESNKLKKIVAMGSVAYNYSKLDESDIDFSSQKKTSKIYGNSKRFLMCSLYELFKNQNNIKLCIAHPGVTLTNMTNHYPKAINWLVKLGVKLVFPKPKNACRSVIDSLNQNCDYMEWIGPKIFNVWGKPKKQKIKISFDESKKIGELTEKIYKNLKNN